MLDFITECAREQGFEYMGVVDAAELEANPQVRDMCAADKCQAFGRSWACPPACGTLEHFVELFGRYRVCLVVQTVGHVEDDFDFEGMQEIGRLHNERAHKMMRAVFEHCDAQGIAPDEMPYSFLTSGACNLCPDCTYPDAPCRFPREASTSMEAAGLLVSDVCAKAGVPYYHGKGTISFTGCILLFRPR